MSTLYQNLYIYKRWNKIQVFTDYIQEIRNQSENDDISEESNKYRFAQLLFKEPVKSFVGMFRKMKISLYDN